MKIVKKIPITNDILKESLLLMRLYGERSLIEVNNLQPSQEFIDKHMKRLKSTADCIREKLSIGDYQITVDTETCCILVSDAEVKDLSYDTNYPFKKDVE
ncbi:hypothetical protein [Clostridium estertheticum]|uniref:hypothetical protein n=1 Tax=Clostridium estertheticum TaxID=238834 RepID=UPI001C0E4A9E|nr:hypothetical protein [Clostridium estertheticum]MBU3186633.1 hypothetical protein [Clostridium estertheticum]